MDSEGGRGTAGKTFQILGFSAKVAAGSHQHFDSLCRKRFYEGY